MKNLYFCFRANFSQRFHTTAVILLISSAVFAQKFTLSGKITDEKEEPLIGANISSKDLGIGTVSDINGNFEIELPSPDVTLTFSYMGYATKYVKLKGEKSIKVVMTEDAMRLDDFVVIGYGVQRKRDLTGSVTSIKSDDLIKFPAASVTEMLRGQAAGIQVTVGNAAPGGASNVLIRGNRSTTAGQTPLYIVDGMIVPGVNDLNPYDISSIEVLKDASAQAIYGSRASNGVILITTKRGESGKVNVDVNAYMGTQRFTRNFDYYTPEEWLRLRFWAKYNDGAAGIGTPDEMNIKGVLNDEVMYGVYESGNLTNWEDELLTNGFQQQYDVSIRGGSEKMKMSAGFGYFEQTGVVKGSGYNRANVRMNTDYAAYKWLDISSNFSFARGNTDLADGSFYQVVTLSPYAKARNEDGSLRTYITSEANPTNIILKNEERHNKHVNDYLNMAGALNFKPFKGFSYRMSGNVRMNYREEGDYYTRKYPGSTGDGSIYEFNRTSWLIDNVINWELPIADKKHKATITLIQSAEEDVQKTTGFSFINSTTDIFDWNIAADSEIRSVTRNIIRTRAMSFAGRVQYNLLDRYLLTASIRRDGASVFGEENKWGNFPSVALAWHVNEESFLKQQTWIDMLKYRISYGKVGNWAISPYTSLGLTDAFEYLLNGKVVIGYLPGSRLPNQSLRWETTGSFNTGLDFSILKGKLSGALEYYNTNTNDLIFQRSIPSLTGYTNILENIGQSKSSGIEVTLNSQLVDNKDLKFSLGVNFSKQKNEVVKLDGRRDENGNYINDGRFFIGQPINVSYDFVFGGVWQLEDIDKITENDYLPGTAKPEAGSVRILDYNNDGRITTDDRKIYNLDPSWYGAINTMLAYKGFDMHLEVYTVQGVTKWNPFLSDFNYGGSLNGKLNGMKVDYWTPQNPSTTAGKPNYTTTAGNLNLLSYQDASYVRLRLATIGYTLPKQLTKRFSVENLRVYFSATNLFTLTDYKSYSPEQTASQYPENQTFVFGVSTSF